MAYEAFFNPVTYGKLIDQHKNRFAAVILVALSIREEGLLRTKV